MTSTTLSTDRLAPSLFSFPMAAAAARQSAARLRALAERMRNRGRADLAQQAEDEARGWEDQANQLQGTRRR